MAGYWDPYYGWRSYHLSPDPPFNSSLHRSRSHGNGPRPEINIYNQNIAEPVLPPSPDQRGRQLSRLGDQLAEEIAALRVSRSRSRSRSDANMPYDYRATGPGSAQWLLAEQQLKTEFELKRAREKLEEEKAKDHEKQLISNYEQRKAEQKEKEKAAEAALIAKLEREKREAKEREEKEYQEFLAKQKAKEAEEKEKAKKREEELEAEMRARLFSHGFTESQVETMIKKNKHPEAHTDHVQIFNIGGNVAPDTDLVNFPGRVPVYPKVHREYLDTETLRYFGIEYEYDKYDRNYIIILQELGKAETEVLFEHTRRLRKGKRSLFLEPSKKPEYSFVRHRSRSKSTSGGKQTVLKIVR